MSGITDIERAACRAVPAREREWCGGWLLQAASGVTGRMNSATCFGVVRGNLEETIEETEDWYRSRNLTPLFRLTELDAVVDHALTRRGYAPRRRPVVVMTRTLPVAVAADGVVELEREEWCEAFRACSEDPPRRLDELCEAFARVTDPAILAARAAEGGFVAVGAVVVTDGYAGIFDLATHPAHRRRGHGRAVTAALLAAASRRGAATAYLQVSTDNAPAHTLYRTMGFADSYRYWYRPASESSTSRELA